MLWSQAQQPEDLQDQMTILIGSAIRLLRGECGVFVVSNESFDPQSSAEYVPYQLEEALVPWFVHVLQEGIQPSSQQPLVVEPVKMELVKRLGLDEELVRQAERCSLLLYDPLGLVGILHFIRSRGSRTSAYEDSESNLHLFITQLATGLRFALKAQSLVKEQGRFSAIFQSSTDGILTVDKALRIIDFNPALEHLTGWRESEVLGRFYFEVLRPKDRQGNDLSLDESPILQSFAAESAIRREIVISARDGQLIEVYVTASCMRSPKGEIMNGILTVRDITDEREQEEQRSRFISVISHELQTPIAIIKGYASTLARMVGKLDQKALRSRLVAIEEEADRLNKLVGNLLYASRIQTGGLLMDVSSLDIAMLIEGVVRRMKARFSAVTIDLDIAAHLPTVVADRDRIEEVLVNLLDNAIKYSPRNQALKVTAHATGDEVIVSISDMGMGISLREQEQIFERFQRAGEAKAQAIPGAGLGLYICRAIVEAHGGRIWVQSTLHHGSTFSFSLPREEKAHLPMVVF